MGMVIGIIVVLALAAFFAVLTCKSKSSDLYKWIGIGLFIAICLTWVLPVGQITSGTFTDTGLQRIGLADLSSVAYYGIYFCLTTVLYFLAIGGFYGVLSKTNSYKNLVNKLSAAVKGKEIIYTTIISLVFIALVSFTKNTVVWFVFVPFVASVLLGAKLDKMTVFTTTFGSILVGILACTYGTESLTYFNYYMSTEVGLGLKYRLIYAAIAGVLYLAFNVFMLSRKLKKKNQAESDVDTYAVETGKGRDKSMWLAIVVLAFLFVFVVLGFFPWSTFNVTCFDSFHTWLTELTIGKDFTLFSYVLGSGALAFGNMEITSIMVLVLLLSVIVSFANRCTLKEYVNNFADGFSKMIKFVVIYACAYTIFVTTYMSPIVPAIVNWFVGLTDKFNPYIFSITGLISSTFHADLGYTGYIVGSVITTTYADYSALAHTIYTATFGIAQLFIPTSGLLLLGLSYLKLDYKSWFKYIWIFVVAMVVALLVLATIVRYC